MSVCCKDRIKERKENNQICDPLMVELNESWKLKVVIIPDVIGVLGTVVEITAT